MGEWTLGGANLGWPVTFALVILALFIRSTITVGSAFLWVRYSRFAQLHRIYRLAYPKEQILSEIKAGVLVVLTDGTLVFLSLMFGIISLQKDPGPTTTALRFGFTPPIAFCTIGDFTGYTANIMLPKWQTRLPPFPFPSSKGSYSSAVS
jgi:hypothetical protein